MSEDVAVTGSIRHRKAHAIREMRLLNSRAPGMPMVEVAQNIINRFPGLWTEEKVLHFIADIRDNRPLEGDDVHTSFTNTPVNSGNLDHTTPGNRQTQAQRTPAKDIKESTRKASGGRSPTLPTLVTNSVPGTSIAQLSPPGTSLIPPEVPDNVFRNHIALGLELTDLERNFLVLKYDMNRMFAPPLMQKTYEGSRHCVAYYEKQRTLIQVKERLTELESLLRGKLAPKDKAIYTAQYNAAALKCKSVLTELEVINLQAEEDGVLRRQVSTYCLNNFYNNTALPVLFPLNTEVTLQNYKTAKLPPPTSVMRPRYLLMKKLGSGGFSTVYKALDLNTALVVALKISRREFPAIEAGDEQGGEDKRWSFLNREAKVYHILKHPNIVQLNSDPFFVNSRQGRVVLNPAYEPYDEIALSMEICSGGDLHDFLALLCRSDKQGRTEHELLTILLQVAEALKYLHSLRPQITHNDISLRNILLSDGGIWKLSDFTLVKPLGDNQAFQMVTSLAGTKPFTAPEKLHRGIFGPASDMYSYGVVAFACFVGNINIFLAPRTMGADLAAEQISARAAVDLSSGNCHICNPSENIINMILNLLSDDMNARMTAEQVCDTLSEALSGYRRTKIKI